MHKDRAELAIDLVRRFLARLPEELDPKRPVERAALALRLRRLRRDLERLDVTPLELCSGEAHDNVFADHCTKCMPRWGYVGTWIVIGEGQKR